MTAETCHVTCYRLQRRVFCHITAENQLFACLESKHGLYRTAFEKISFPARNMKLRETGVAFTSNMNFPKTLPTGQNPGSNRQLINPLLLNIYNLIIWQLSHLAYIQYISILLLIISVLKNKCSSKELLALFE